MQTHYIDGICLEHHDPKDAFNKAIKLGSLTENSDDDNYAGKYMYMHTLDGVHRFKSIMTRKYDVTCKA